MELLDQMVLTCLVYETADGLPDKMLYLHPHNQHKNSSHPLPSLDSTWCCQNSPLYHSHEQTSPFQQRPGSFLEDYKQDEERDTAAKGWVPQMSSSHTRPRPLLTDLGSLPWVQ